jgi:2-phosphosulfolactate phosphatase
MGRTLAVHFLPREVDPARFVGGVVVVIDVLRATTTMIHALANGAREVIPCAEIDEARAVAARCPAGSVVLGGERGGRPIPGFDLGNSPASYRPDLVAGKTVVMTTTNGTLALLHARTAERVLVGAFANLGAIIRTLRAETRPIHLLCAGSEGDASIEDVLFAGAVVTHVGEASGQFRTSDEKPMPDGRAEIAAAAYVGRGENSDARLATFLTGKGGALLDQLGLRSDVIACAEVDTADVVPVMENGWLHAGTTVPAGANASGSL